MLKNIDVMFISLVRAGANRRKIIIKQDGSFSIEVPIAKTDEERRVVYGIVYAPDEVDAQGDFTTAEEIRKAAYRFMQNLRLRNVDTNHDYDPKDAYVCESWIVRKGDTLFVGEKEGAWAVGIHVLDDAVWDAVRRGELQGISMAGVAERVEVSKADGFGFWKEAVDMAWDGSQARYTNLQYARACAYVEGYENPHSDPIPADYPKNRCKLPHHEPDGRVNLRGLRAAAAAIQGARGGVDLPQDALERAKEHIERHYHALGMKAPWEVKKGFFSRFFKGGDKMDEKKIQEMVEKAVETALAKRENLRKEEEFRAEVMKAMQEIQGVVEKLQHLEERLKKIEESGTGRKTEKETEGQEESVWL